MDLMTLKIQQFRVGDQIPFRWILAPPGEKYGVYILFYVLL